MKHNNGRDLRAARTLLILAGVVAFAACGDGFWATGNPPAIDSFTADNESVAEGDSITFVVVASGPRRIDEIHLALSGAMNEDLMFSVEDPAASIDDTVSIFVPQGTPVAELTVEAWVVDASDTESGRETLTVQITDQTPPTASVTATPDQTAAGETITMDVTASDNRAVASVGVNVTNGADYDTTLTATIAQPAAAVTRTFTLETPQLDLGDLTITPLVTDINGFEGAGSPVTVGLEDRKGPTFVSLETSPESTIPLGDSVQVFVTVSDPAGIQQVTMIGLAHQGEPSMGTDSVVERFLQRTIEFPRPTQPDTLPRTVNLDPFLYSADLTTSDTVHLVVVAEDGIGNVSDTTKIMFVGGPDVGITYPPEGHAVGVGDVFNVRVSVYDGTGIDSAHLVVSGALNQTFVLALPSRTDTAMDQLVQEVTMPASAGSVEFQAWAWNASNVGGQSRRITVDVLSDAPPDGDPPVVSLSAERLVPGTSEQRMELLDEVRITASAFDGNSGLQKVGYIAVVNRSDTQIIIGDSVDLAGSKDLERMVFRATLDSIYNRLGVDPSPAVRDSILPEDLNMRIHAFATDMEGNRSCATGQEEQLDCENVAGLFFEIDVVRGRTVLLANEEAIIADLVFDTLHERLYMSDINSNLVWGLPVHEALSSLVADSQFSVPVGAAPWGLFIGERGADERMLIVANSGGTNMSFVDIAPTDPSLVNEVDILRMRTPNSSLHEVQITQDDNLNNELTEVVPVIDFSDRPQFLAQDMKRRIVFATVGTEFGPTTTLRYIVTDPDPDATTDTPEMRLILPRNAIEETDGQYAIANVDSLNIDANDDANDLIELYTHVPGYPGSTLASGYLPDPGDAAAALNDSIAAYLNARGDGADFPLYAVRAERGSWDTSILAYSDTTHISASEDRTRIVIGEGVAAPAGRILMWFADDTSPTPYSDHIPVQDLMNNASEQVLGVGLNQNGSLGVARGREATYFFDADLRLQGLYGQPASGGAGAAFHPAHDDVFDGGDETAAGGGFAFTGTSEQSVEVVNTFHFYQVAELAIRDNIVGPLRVGYPLRSEQGCVGADCVVAKIYAITSAGGVVILNVRRRDLE